MKKLIFFLALFSIGLLPYDGFSQACTKTAATGDWNIGATWTPSGVPASGDVICIPAGVTVTIQANTQISLTSGTTILNVYGTLVWGGTGNDNTSLTLSGTSSLNFYTGATLVPGSNGSQIYLTFETTPTPITYNKQGVLDLTTGTSYPSGAPLPVELLQFLAKKSDNQSIGLSWQTASELNNEKFLIERSQDGRDFKVIGEVAGAGTDYQQNDYTFVDESPLPGANYYRLKQMDFDGKFSMSPVRMVVLKPKGETAVYPTVTAGEFFVQTADDEITAINIYDMQGMLIEKIITEGGQNAAFELSKQAAGTYLVVVHTERGTSHHRVIRP